MRRAVMPLLLALFLAAPAPATADKARARSLFKKAETEYRLGHFQEALRGYEATLKEAHHPSIIFNIAQCHRQLKDPRKALFYYRLFLSDWERVKPGTAPPNKKEVDGRITTLSAEAAALDQAEAARKQAAAEEEARQQAAAAEEEARKQAAAEEARKQAAAEEEARQQAAEDKRRAALDRPLVAGATKPAELAGGGEAKEPKKIAIGHVKLVGPEQAGAKVTVSGVPMGTTPLSKPLRLAAGRNRIIVELEDHHPFSRVVTVESGKTVDLEVTLKRSKTPGRILLGTSILCFVLAGGSLAIGQIFDAEYKERTEQWDEYNSWLANGQPLPAVAMPTAKVDEKHHDLSLAGHVLTSVFGAAALGTLIGFFYTLSIDTSPPDDPDAEPAKVSISPTINGLKVTF